MARSTKRGTRNVQCGKPFGLLFAGIALLFSPSNAADESLIYSPDWPSYQWFASTDPKNENEDYLLLEPGEKRRVPLAAGVLNRLWFTALEPDKIDVSLVFPGQPLQNITRGGIVVNKAWARSRALVWEKAFTSYHSQAIPIDGVPLAWQTLPQGAQLEVINKSQNPEGNKFFYQASVRPPFKVAPIEGGTEQTLNRKIELASGEAESLNLDGSGLIVSIALALAELKDRNALHVSIAFDGNSKNSVEAPLTALLGVFETGRLSGSAAFDFNGIQHSLKWPMSFGKGAKITLKNNSAKPLLIEANIVHRSLSQAPAYRFHAIYGSMRTQQKKPLRMLNVKAKGAFCGMNLSITPAPDSGRRTFAYLEGNETITADGKKYEGTGTEDFFSSAWYFPEPDMAFNFPYHGMTAKTKVPPGVSAYRLMIPDALPFKQSLQFDFEHGNANNSNDLLFRWVAFWYQTPGGQFEVTDALQETSEATDGPAHGNIFLVALITALIVGGGGGLLVKAARNRAEKSS